LSLASWPVSGDRTLWTVAFDHAIRPTRFELPLRLGLLLGCGSRAAAKAGVHGSPSVVASPLVDLELRPEARASQRVGERVPRRIRVNASCLCQHRSVLQTCPVGTPAACPAARWTRAAADTSMGNPIIPGVAT
jgi:hypothetical protein